MARRLLVLHANKYQIGVAYGRSGFGDLKRTAKGWNAAAKGIPFFLLTDLDLTFPCPSALVEDWLDGAERKHPNLIFRVAVREVEAWLLADAEGLAAFLGLSVRHVPAVPEGLTDPKAALIELARRARSKELRERIVPRTGSTAVQGREYNSCLCEFVRGGWSPERASHRSLSLARAIQRLSVFEPDWENLNP
ncbi:MAG: hypothetical protein KJZ84_12930 [Bryobacteraceae bacterium]|nr:hypothetical protein [Bryobacteraceae bacterium]